MQEQEDVLKYVLLSDPVFEEMRARYLDWKNNGFAQLDRNIEASVRKLNELPGLVTHYSCEGHEDQFRHCWQGFCIVTGLTVQGLSHMRYLWGGLHKRILEKSHELPVFMLLPRFVKLEFQMMPNAGITSQLGPMDWVPMCVIQVQGEHPPVMAAPFWKMFEETIDAYSQACLGQET